MNRTCAAALTALVLCGVSPAAAQEQLVTTFVPETLRRWDAAGFVGWRGVDKSEMAPDWNDWYDVAAFSGSVGRYLTPHLKIEVDLATTSQGRVFSETFFAPPPAPPFPPPFYTPPSYTLREHEFRRTTLGATLPGPAIAAQTAPAHNEAATPRASLPICIGNVKAMATSTSE